MDRQPLYLATAGRPYLKDRSRLILANMNHCSTVLINLIATHLCARGILVGH